MSPFVVGIDVSLTSTGVATPLGVLRIRSKGKADDSLTVRRGRLRGLTEAIVEAALYHGRPDLVVIEGPSFASVGGHPHDRSGLWWLVVDALRELDLPVAVMVPSARCKYGTGKGNASKDAVFAETIRRYPTFAVDGNDVADALLLCAAGMDYLSAPLAELPQTHRTALDKVEWPELKV